MREKDQKAKIQQIPHRVPSLSRKEKSFNINIFMQIDFFFLQKKGEKTFSAL